MLRNVIDITIFTISFILWSSFDVNRYVRTYFCIVYNRKSVNNFKLVCRYLNITKSGLYVIKFYCFWIHLRQLFTRVFLYHNQFPWEFFLSVNVLYAQVQLCSAARWRKILIFSYSNLRIFTPLNNIKKAFLSKLFMLSKACLYAALSYSLLSNCAKNIHLVSLSVA